MFTASMNVSDQLVIVVCESVMEGYALVGKGFGALVLIVVLKCCFFYVLKTELI